jgi:hypothetical protein
LYVHEVSTPEVAAAEATDGSAVDASIVLGMVLGQVRSQFGAAGHVLAAAQQAVDRARSSADQVVAAMAATLARQALRVLTPLPTPAPTTSPTSSGPAASRPGVTTPGHPVPAARYPSPLILGAPALTAAELSGWYAGGSHRPQLTVPIGTLAGYYQSAGAAVGVRDDIAFAQSVLETDYFSFPAGGQVAPGDNNFAGIGACDSCTHGWHFADAQTGVAAQLQLLHDYATTKPAPGPLPGPIGETGCCPTWMALTGVWATAQDYGYNILTLYRQMLEWALPRQRSSAGL